MSAPSLILNVIPMNLVGYVLVKMAPTYPGEIRYTTLNHELEFYTNSNGTADVY